MKILMVCLGNHCRSPLAEGILKSKLGSRYFTVDSAGTDLYHVGCPPDKRVVSLAQSYGIDLSNLRARQITAKDLDLFDCIYVMDKNNYRGVIKLAKNDTQRQNVKFILNELNPAENLEVPDPYYGKEEDFLEVYKMLDAACVAICEKLTNGAQK